MIESIENSNDPECMPRKISLKPKIMKILEVIFVFFGPFSVQPGDLSEHRSLFAQFRALLFDFCHRYKLEPSEVKMGGSFSQHMLRHAVWLLNRFQLHSSDQKTSFQRRWGVPFSNPVLPFGELVLAQTQHAESAKLDHRLQPQRSLAIWLGRCEATGEHILAKANNTSLVKSRTVTRLSLEGSTDLSVFKSISIPAPELSSAASVKMAKEGDQPTDQQGGESKLRLDYRLKLTHNLPSKDQEADPGINQQLSNQLWFHHRAWHNLLHQHLCHNNSNQLSNQQLCNQRANNHLQQHQLLSSLFGGGSRKRAQDQQPPSFTTSWKRLGQLTSLRLQSTLRKKSFVMQRKH